MNIDKEIEELSKIDKDFKIGFYTRSDTYIASTELMSNIIKKHSRFTPDSGLDALGLFITHDKETCFSIELTEFVPCCGKAIGRRLMAREFYYARGEHIVIGEEKSKKAFNVLFSVVDQVIENAQYSSISLIVSASEQPIFHKLIETRQDWKAINEFKNERMSGKHRCVEYCKNYFGN